MSIFTLFTELHGFGQKFSLSQLRKQRTRVIYELSRWPCLPRVLPNSEVIRAPGRHSGRSSNSVGARIFFFVQAFEMTKISFSNLFYVVKSHNRTPPHFGALNRESKSSGSQPVYRKLFPRGPHSSKNNLDIPANALRLSLCLIMALDVVKCIFCRNCWRLARLTSWLRIYN